MVLEYCQGCGRKLKEADGRTHCAKCVREIRSERLPKWLRPPETPALLRPRAGRRARDTATLPLLGVE